MQVSSKIEVLDRMRSGCDRIVPICSFGDVSIILGAGAAHSGAQCVLGFLHYCLVSTRDFVPNRFSDSRSQPRAPVQGMIPKLVTFRHKTVAESVCAGNYFLRLRALTPMKIWL